MVSWGRALYFPSGPETFSDVVSITTSIHSFAAIKTDGSVVAWGGPSEGGSISAAAPDFICISRRFAFARFRTQSNSGNLSNLQQLEAVAADLTSGVKSIVSSSHATRSELIGCRRVSSYSVSWVRRHGNRMVKTPAIPGHGGRER